MASSRHRIVRAATDKPRVLFVVDVATLGGASIPLLHLAKWLQQRGWDAVVGVPESGPVSDLLQAEGIPVVIEPTLLAPTRGNLRNLCAQFDVVVANAILTWPVVYAAHQEQIPVIWHLHDTLEAAGVIRAIPEIQPALELADLLVAPTEQMARIFQDLTRRPIEIVPYGIPPPPSSPRTDPDRITTFVAVESFAPGKGQDILLEAIRRLEPARADAAVFQMAGRISSPEFYRTLRDHAADLENVEFFDALDHEASRKFVASADVLICPSRDETMPIAILEAMALGKAVITADVGGVSEWVRDGMNGLIVPREDAEALAGAIERCLADAELVRELGASARQTFAHHFTLDRFGARFAQLLNDVSRSGPAPTTVSNYNRWVADFDTPGQRENLALRRRLRSVRRHPLISVLLPVYNANLEFLETAIASVRHQVYDRWELCLADDASTVPGLREFLEEAARSDPRIKLVLRERNGHISACSSSALALATGEFCALLDHDDALAENALALVALEIERFPDAGLIYSDEDKIDGVGARSSPFFKPDWNPELFLGQNFVSHLGVYRADLLRELGGFRKGFEGSQDYDLALRCLERLRPEQVRHIPRILYHWRMIPGSGAAVVDAKSYAKDAARRAIGDHLRRQGIAGRVEACPENTELHRVVYELPQPQPLVSIIIPMRDHVSLLEQCLASLRGRSGYAGIEIIVVDNGSTEEATHRFLRTLEQEKDARVLRDDGAFNFSHLNNRAAAVATGNVLLFLNNDIEAEERGWLHEMVSHAVRPGVGAVGARLWYPNGTLQHGGVIVGLGGVAGHAFYHVPRGHSGYYDRAFLQQNCSAVTAACMAVRKSVFEEAGGFNEVDLRISFNDVDFCLRLRERGYQNLWTPYANLIHHESSSRGHQATREEQAQFVREAAYMHRTWGEALLHDPFYNPNLALDPPGYELAFPPRRAEDGSASDPIGFRAIRAEVLSRSDCVPAAVER